MTALTGVLLALLASYGVFLIYTAWSFGWSGAGVGPRIGGGTIRRDRVREFLVQAGLEDIRLPELAAVMGALFVVGAASGFALFGGALPPLAIGLFAATFPVAAARGRRAQRRVKAQEAWPRMIEEIRLQATALGRSIPQALLTVGLRGPLEFRSAFQAANREWLLSTDFDRTLSVVKQRLADPTADAVCETLLIAHEIGGSDVDRRLAALIDDRIQDVQGRKDADSKQAGARFARRFVLGVPFGMALAGLSIGSGREAYGTPLGQTAALVGLGLMVACWAWAGRIMRLPTEERVFYG